jgi:hypothetical protein
VATTRYLVRIEAQPICPKSKAPSTSSTVWVDSQGRLVQVRHSTFVSPRFFAPFLKANPALADVPMGQRTLTETLRLSAFGAPVRIAAPNPQTGGVSLTFPVTGSGSAVARCG